ncbi:pyocin activator PrtN family protein [Pseudomonas silvicola]|nr:pyocin activator PrtN family protein [Pseudomonas silvicola]
MKTIFLLMAQYEGKAIVPLSNICADYFTHLTIEMFQRKVLAGQIKIPITRLEASQKSAKGIHITDLANYLDEQREEALKEYHQLNGAFASGRR